MYRSNLSRRDRAVSLFAVMLIHVGLGVALLRFSGVEILPDAETITQLIPIAREAPPPPEVDIPVQDEAAPEEEGAASPANIRSNATAVVAPEPRIPLPIPPPMPVSSTPGQGSEATQGAAPIAGPGTGAGGTGAGTGAGGSGSGPGGGGMGQGSRPSLATRGLGLGDFPPEIARRLPRRGAVFTIVRVQPDGRPESCRIGRSSGDRAVDDWTCSLIMNRLRFNPARDGNGRPVADFYGYVQEFRTR
jgi:periplasmic protein TonB